jgi:hypothetical protein
MNWRSTWLFVFLCCVIFSDHVSADQHWPHFFYSFLKSFANAMIVCFQNLRIYMIWLFLWPFIYSDSIILWRRTEVRTYVLFYWFKNFISGPTPQRCCRKLAEIGFELTTKQLPAQCLEPKDTTSHAYTHTHIHTSTYIHTYIFSFRFPHQLHELDFLWFGSVFTKIWDLAHL